MNTGEINTMEWFRRSSRVWVPWVLFASAAVLLVATAVILVHRLRGANEQMAAEFAARNQAEQQRAATEKAYTATQARAAAAEAQAKTLAAERDALAAKVKALEARSKAKPAAKAKATKKKRRR